MNDQQYAILRKLEPDTLRNMIVDLWAALDGKERAMFDHGCMVGKTMAAKHILLMLPGCPDAQMLADAIKEKFGIGL